MNKTTRFPFFFFIAELAYVVWVAFKTYHLDLNNDDDAALFYRLSLFFLIAAGIFFNFEPSTEKYKKFLFIIPLALWISLYAGVKIKDYDSGEAHKEKFLDVAEYGSPKRLKSLQNKYAFNNFVLGKALDQAIGSDNGETVMALYELGCPLNYSHLNTALRYRYFSAADAILDSGISVDIVNSEGMTPLQVAANNQMPDAVEYLLKKGADPLASAPLGLNALFYAVNTRSHGEWDEARKVISLLEEYGADLHCTNSYGHTLLDYCKSGFRDYIKGLGIEKGTDANYGITSLHRAAEAGDLIQIKEILRDGSVFIDYGDEDYWFTPLYYAIFSEKIEAVKLLVESGADINLPDKRGITPYACASSYDIPKDILQYLLEHGAY